MKNFKGVLILIAILATSINFSQNNKKMIKTDTEWKNPGRTTCHDIIPKAGRALQSPDSGIGQPVQERGQFTSTTIPAFDVRAVAIDAVRSNQKTYILLRNPTRLQPFQQLHSIFQILVTRFPPFHTLISVSSGTRF